MNLTFSAFQLILNEKKPGLEVFNELNEEQYNTKENTYKINIEKIDNRFLWIYIRYGGSLPYSQEVVDIKTDEIMANPRKINHVELNQQLFCLYDSKDYYFYLSNSKKKTFLEKYLKQTLSKDCIIKRFFKSKEDFVNNIQTIDSISFTSKNNLFSVNNELFGEPKDIFGLGQPENFKMQINYNNRSITTGFKDKFLNLIDKKDNSEIQSLVCIGKDDNGIESIFDINSFTQTRALNLKKDNAGMFEPDTVKQNLINNILGKKDV